MDRKTRLLIVDDQKLFAENLKSVLEFRSSEFEIVGLAKDGQAAIDLVRQDPPEIILMDVRMPGVDGVQATRIIHQEFPAIHIVVLTTFDDDEYIHEALRVGAMGYLLKDIPFTELLASLRAVRDGTVPFSPGVISKLIRGAPQETLRTEPDEKPSPVSREEAGPAVPVWLKTLSRREREILGLMAQGFDNLQIASELFIGEQTVKNYVYGIYSKLGEHNRIKVVQMLQNYRSLLTAP